MFQLRKEKRKYEEHRPEGKFNSDWQAKRPWLKFENIKKQHDIVQFVSRIRLSEVVKTLESLLAPITKYGSPM